MVDSFRGDLLHPCWSNLFALLNAIEEFVFYRPNRSSDIKPPKNPDQARFQVCFRADLSS